MNDLYLTDEELRIQVLEDKITRAILKINHDTEVNKRCLCEECNPDITRLLKLWLKYNDELVEILRDEI